MSFEEMVVALVGSIGAFALVGFLAAKTFGLIKTWINRKKSGVPEEEFNRLARAFMEHKKDTQRRIQNLEAIIADDDSTESFQEEDSSKQIEAPKESIEFDDSENVSEKSESNGNNENNLRNMLRE
ncbi:hypothetical protein GWN26_15455 [Candidatus Saccharibacteria bacterium]|nr:hypothetical protein [Candidatus Saccharibacteria bacterium]